MFFFRDGWVELLKGRALKKYLPTMQARYVAMCSCVFVRVLKKDTSETNQEKKVHVQKNKIMFLLFCAEMPSSILDN